MNTCANTNQTLTKLPCLTFVLYVRSFDLDKGHLRLQSSYDHGLHNWNIHASLPVDCTEKVAELIMELHRVFNFEKSFEINRRFLNFWHFVEHVYSRLGVFVENSISDLFWFMSWRHGIRTELPDSAKGHWNHCFLKSQNAFSFFMAQTQNLLPFQCFSEFD